MGRLVDIEIPADVLSRAREADECAQAAVYAALAPTVFGLIRRLAGNRSLAEDLFQDTMMAVFQCLESFRGEAPIGAWVRRIAVSKCLMYLRSPWHRARVRLRSELDGEWNDEVSPGWGRVFSSSGSDGAQALAGSGSGVPRALGGRGPEVPGRFGARTVRTAAEPAPLWAAPPDPEWLDVERALATLSPTARAIVWLFEVEGYSHEEIARSFGKSVSFSKSQLARAHAKLRQWFEPPTPDPTCITPLDL